MNLLNTSWSPEVNLKTCPVPFFVISILASPSGVFVVATNPVSVIVPVQDCGSAVSGLAKGDLVVAPFVFCDMACPHCKARDAEVISLFGTQAMTLQYRCRACGTVFEALKY